MSKSWNNKWALSLTAPVLLALSFPPFNASILQIPAFIVLFQLSLLCDTKREVTYYAYPSFVLWNLFSTYWLMMATLAGGLAAIFANAAIMLIPLLIIRSFFKSECNPIFVSIFAAATWVSYEFLHHNWDLAWPWLTLGNGWSNLTGVIQYISITGVFGISFWVVLTASLLFLWLKNQSKQLLIAGCVAFLLFPLLSIITFIGIQSSEESPTEVVIIQPNSDSYEQFGGHPNVDSLIDKLLTLSDRVRTDQTDLIIWPENAISTSLTIENRYFNRISDSLKVWNTQLITGSGFFDFYEDTEKPQVYRQTQNGSAYNVYNAALYFRPDIPTEVYKKGELVPIVERFPFVEFFQKIDYYEWVDWASLSGYGLGTTANLFDVNGEKTPALICYDSVFPGWVNQFVAEGADFLTIITNDGWWGDSHGHIQHFAFARLRAIEHRMWIARSANNGISGIISPDGKIQRETEYWTEDAFRFTIYSNTKSTFYSRFGNWIGYLSLALMVVGFVAVRLHRNNRQKQSYRDDPAE